MAVYRIIPKEGVKTCDVFGVKGVKDVEIAGNGEIIVRTESCPEIVDAKDALQELSQAPVVFQNF